MPAAAVIGLGVGAEHIDGYRKAGVEITAVCDFDRAKAKRVAAEHDVPFWTTDWREVIDRADMISVASWDQYHAEQALAALAAGKQVLVEKPLCLDHADIARLRAAAIGRRLEVNFPLRHSGFEESVRRNWPGLRKGLVLRYRWGRSWKLLGWRRQCPGYSIVHGAGSHLFDIVAGLFQEGENFEISAKGWGRRPGYDGITDAEILFMAKGLRAIPLVIELACGTEDGNHRVSALVGRVGRDFVGNRRAIFARRAAKFNPGAGLPDVAVRRFASGLDGNDHERLFRGSELAFAVAALVGK